MLMPRRGLPSDIEPACAYVLAALERRPVSLRAAIEELKPPVPRGMLNALCLGTLRNYKLVERMLRKCGVKGPFRGSMRGWLPIIGGYEAVFRREHVDAPRIIDKTGLSGEAVRCLREMDPDEVVKDIRDPVRRLAVRYSVPRWVVEELIRVEPPGGVEELLRSFQSPTPLWLRVNTSRIERERALHVLNEIYGILAKPDPILGDLVEVVNAPPGALDELPRSVFYLEDRAPAAAVHMLARSMGSAAGYRVADFFSAPGNKAAHLAWLKPGGSFTAVDLSPRRIMSERRLHGMQELAALISYIVGDAQVPPLRGGFDAVIVDPDCTSIGRLGHSPETRLFLEQAGRGLLRRVRRVQLRGLRAAARLLRRGGLLLYTTCTLTLGENEEIVSVALDEGLEPVDTGVALGTEAGIRGGRRFYPHVTRSTGGFAVVLEKL